MADSPAEIKKTIAKFWLVGIILFIFTGVTVAVATVPALDFGAHGFDTADMVIGLLIACFKASLVALIFMHLNHEKSLIYITFGMAIFFGIALFALTALAFVDPIYFAGFFNR